MESTVPTTDSKLLIAMPKEEPSQSEGKKDIQVIHVNKKMRTSSVSVFYPRPERPLPMPSAADATKIPTLLFAFLSKPRIIENLSMSARDDDDRDYLNPLHAIPRIPVSCVLPKCPRPVAISSILSHFLFEHSRGCDYVIEYQEVFENQRKNLIFDVGKLDFGENVCLGMLAYGGKKGKPSTLPGMRKISLHNSFLPLNKEHLRNHLCVLVMACRTSWHAIATSDPYRFQTMKNPAAKSKEVIFVWLTSAPTLQPIFCSISVFDLSMQTSASVITRMRPFSKSQDPADFALIENNFLRLTHGEINSLTHNREKFIFLEVCIHEYSEFDFVQLDQEEQQQRKDTIALYAKKLKEEAKRKRSKGRGTFTAAPQKKPLAEEH